MTVRKLADLGRRGGEGRMSHGSGVSGGSHLTKGPGGPSRELDLRLEDSGLHGAFGREWCDQCPEIWRRILKGQEQKPGERSRAFATVPRQQKLKVRPGAVAVRREEGKRLKKFFRDQIRRTRC